jgi:prepilin-type N-terminal cleavage/methylation domain-containing protein
MPNEKCQISNKKGYTLIEILVGLTIIGLIFNFGYASFREFSYRQALANAARRLRADLRLAQEQALSGKKPDGCSVLDGYRFRGSSTSYSLFPVCAGTEFTGQAKEVSFSDITLSFDPPSTTSVLFKVLGQGNDLSSDLEINLTQMATANVQKVVVTKGGEIK